MLFDKPRYFRDTRRNGCIDLSSLKLSGILSQYLTKLKVYTEFCKPVSFKFYEYPTEVLCYVLADRQTVRQTDMSWPKLICSILQLCF